MELVRIPTKELDKVWGLIEKDIRKELLNFRKYIEKNCKNVGDNFPHEARKIHYDKKTYQYNYRK